jgi:LysR family transcriptional regulator, nitrogen assimilation regulatory protein
VDLRQLRYFTVVARQQHFGRAASILHIAQPALSRQIKLLEEELGVALFERHARGATPTEAAGLLLDRASFMLRYAEQVKHDIAATQLSARGPIALGMSPGVALVLAALLVEVVRARHPDVRLQIVEQFSDVLQAQLLDGTLDLAILNGPIDLPDFVTSPLLSERICLIGAADDDRLRRSRITIADLAGIPLILAGVAKSGVRLELEAATARTKTSLTVLVEVQTIGVAKRVVLRDGTCTIHFAAPIKSDIEAGSLRAVPIEGLKIRRFLARAAGRQPSRATLALTDIVKEVVSNLVRSGEWPNASLPTTPQSAASSR